MFLSGKDCSLVSLAGSGGRLPGVEIFNFMSFHGSLLDQALSLTPSCLGYKGESGLGQPNMSPSRQISESELFVIPAHRRRCNAHVMADPEVQCAGRWSQAV